MTNATYEAGVTFRDSSGNQVTVPIYVISTASLPADVLGQLGFVASQLDLLTEAQIVKITARVNLIPSGVKASPVAGSELSVGGLVQMISPSEGREYSLWVPAWIRSNFQGDVLRLPATWLTNGNSTYWTSGGSPPFQSDRYGNAINGPQRGNKSIHKLRREIASVLRG